MSAEMGALVREMADHDGKSMNRFVIMLLERAIPTYRKEAGLDGE